MAIALNRILSRCCRCLLKNRNCKAKLQRAISWRFWNGKTVNSRVFDDTHIPTDGPKRLTLRRLRAQGNDMLVKQLDKTIDIFEAKYQGLFIFDIDILEGLETSAREQTTLHVGPRPVNAVVVYTSKALFLSAREKTPYSNSFV